MTQNIVGHLKYTLRLVDGELQKRINGVSGPGSVAELRALHRQVWEDRYRRAPGSVHWLSTLDPQRHPLASMIETWPPEHPLTVAVQALVDYAWRPVEFQKGGRFRFPKPGTR